MSILIDSSNNGRSMNVKEYQNFQRVSRVSKNLDFVTLAIFEIL
jgi:hypothetical protein